MPNLYSFIKHPILGLLDKSSLIIPGLEKAVALYFDESINVSLNLPIIRTSVDHGTAFDIAYKGIASNKSYINAVKAAISQ